MFQPEDVLLLGPGPSPTSPAVRSAQAMPLIGHLDPAMLELLDSVQSRLRILFGTTNPLTLPLAGTGSSGMEAVIANLVERGDRVVVGVHGVFGQRLAESARRAGAQVEAVCSEFGEPVDVAKMIEALEGGPTRAVFVVHAETSTGVLTDLRPIADAVRGTDALFVVDCVTSLGGVELSFDELGVDAAFSGTQKCLSCPPGLAPVTFSPRAIERAEARSEPVPFYFDLKLLNGYFGSERVYHYTTPISMIYAIDAALEEVLEEGLPARAERHREVAAELRAGLPDLGLRPLVPVEHATPMLTPICYPDGVNDAAFRSHLRQVHGIEVGAGLGPLAGSAFRVGLMGYGARSSNVRRALDAFGDALKAARE